MSPVILRADPTRVRVSIRAPLAGSNEWEAWVTPLPHGKPAPAFERTPEAAVERALARAASIHMPGVYPDGAVFPHPQDPSPGSGKVTP